MRAAALALALLLGAPGCGWLGGQEEPAPVTHVVRRGDTLWAIARRYGTTVEALRAANGLAGDRIEVGQVLVVPEGSAPSAAPRPARPRRRAAPARRSAPAAPARRPCLAGPADVAGDSGDEPAYAASRGLDPAAAREALRAVPELLADCPRDAERAGVEMRVALDVACTGEVTRVEILDDGGARPALAACVSERLRGLSFPPHDLPDGDRIEVPLTLTW